MYKFINGKVSLHCDMYRYIQDSFSCYEGEPEKCLEATGYESYDSFVADIGSGLNDGDFVEKIGYEYCHLFDYEDDNKDIDWSILSIGLLKKEHPCDLKVFDECKYVVELIFNMDSSIIFVRDTKEVYDLLDIYMPVVVNSKRLL